jgi:hypothetical protein
MMGASEYLVWLDGRLVEDGPARFATAHPESQTLNFTLQAGLHLIAVQVHNEGVATRVLPLIRPFLWSKVSSNGSPIEISWKCERLTGYQSRTRRISDNLGWIDWCDTSQMPADWQGSTYDDSGWKSPIWVDPGIGQITEAKTHPVRMNEIPIRPIARGSLAEGFGYSQDDPAAKFFLAELAPKDIPAQGVWRRYDLGRVRLGRPDITLDLPKGAVVEYALCEQLRHGRVHAWITLSGSQSCNFDHFVARGGIQEFMPFTPKGGRFLEIHVYANGPVKFVKEEFLERTYYGEPEGSFTCSDALLNRIWKTGVDTMRACSEDSFVDCPTRERGEWTGDVASVATDICGVAYSDLSLTRRALVQAAQSARADGLVAGLGPGDDLYVSTYAAQWVAACFHYHEITGDKSLLTELLGAAERNIAVYQSKMTTHGLQGDLGWEFVDWGYVPNTGPSDMALNIDYYMALQAMARWHQALGLSNAEVLADSAKLGVVIKDWLAKQIQRPGGWDNVGYHRAALALLAGLVGQNDERPCIQAIESQLLTCFPNDPTAPRLSDPQVASDRFMTPYFCHFAFAALLNHGEVNFVLDQYRKCWGWALKDDQTTWLEVFDTRWSHCHEWSGCPTWQLSRYVLGLRPRFDVGFGVYDVNIQPENLTKASGDIPLERGETIHVEWTATENGIRLAVTSPTKIKLRIGKTEVEVLGKYETLIARKTNCASCVGSTF